MARFLSIAEIWIEELRFLKHSRMSVKLPTNRKFVVRVILNPSGGFGKLDVLLV